MPRCELAQPGRLNVPVAFGATDIRFNKPSRLGCDQPALPSLGSAGLRRCDRLAQGVG